MKNILLLVFLLSSFFAGSCQKYQQMESMDGDKHVGAILPARTVIVDSWEMTDTPRSWVMNDTPRLITLDDKGQWVPWEKWDTIREKNHLATLANINRNAFGDTLDVKSYSDTSGKYVIRYKIDVTHWFESLVAYFPEPPQGNPRHYDAEITVYRQTPTTSIKVNSLPIHGTYVKEGCFEDVPARWVSMALAQKFTTPFP